MNKHKCCMQKVVFPVVINAHAQLRRWGANLRNLLDNVAAQLLLVRSVPRAKGAVKVPSQGDVPMKTNSGFVVIAAQQRQNPAIVCEKCGEIIADYEMAGVVWQECNYDEGSRRRVIVLCKRNDCLNSEAYKHLPWQGFKHYALWLLYNSGMKTEQQMREAWKSAERINGV